jgi:putative aldouronate transport system permease protein
VPFVPSSLDDSPSLIGRKHNKLIANIRQWPALHIMLAIGVAWFIVFKYVPMAGVIIAFQKYKLFKGLWGSDWVGLTNFIRFANDPYAFRVIRNTFLLALYTLAFGFPAPIILALLLNEVHNQTFKRVAQSASYLPHFISTVVVVGLITMVTASDGVLNSLFVKPFTGGSPLLFMQRPEWFRPLYVASEIWQDVGWGSIIYLAAIAGIDPELYEAAKIDGASRLQCVRRITFPLMLPTIRLLLILRMGQLLNIGFEKVYLMYGPSTYETADVLRTYVYRIGIVGGQDFSYGAAIGFFNSLASLIMIVVANYTVKRLSGEGIY